MLDLIFNEESLNQTVLIILEEKLVDENRLLQYLDIKRISVAYEYYYKIFLYILIRISNGQIIDEKVYEQIIKDYDMEYQIFKNEQELKKIKEELSKRKKELGEKEDKIEDTKKILGKRKRDQREEAISDLKELGYLWKPLKKKQKLKSKFIIHNTNLETVVVTTTLNSDDDDEYEYEYDL